MKRSELLQSAGALALFSAALPRGAAAATTIANAPLTPASDGVPVAFLLSDGAVMIDFAGPWEVFQDVNVPGRMQSAFNLYMVAESTQPVTISGGARVIPQYDFVNAPQPKVVVVPAQAAPTPATKEWLRMVARQTDVVMSVCTGALVLAAAGLLDGRNVTTHHGSFATLAMDYPSVTVERGVRYVDDGSIATSAGLTAGIDLAMHIVQRYYGRDNATQTAYYMEYLSSAWNDPHSNAVYGKPPAARAGLAVCAVCWMSVDPKTSPSSFYGGKRYYFCMTAHKQAFDSAPTRFLS